MIYYPFSFFANYGDIVELSFNSVDLNQIEKQCDKYEWVYYNKFKPKNNRWGLSLTSLDGGMSGDPDLGSLYEYNKKNGTNISEFDFSIRTPLCSDLPDLSRFLDNFYFPNVIGRSHILKLDTGGFFPTHRDHNNLENRNKQPFRVIVPLVNVSGYSSLVWLLEGKPIQLDSGKFYLINTSKAHSLFSFSDNNKIVVFNFLCTPETFTFFENNMKIK